MKDQEYINELKKGNNDSFRELVDNYKDRVYNTSLGIVQNYEDAEDIVQEVFAEVFQSINDFRGDSKLSTWIYQITVRKSLDEIRKRNSKKRFAFISSLFDSKTNRQIYDKPDFIHPGVLLEDKEKSVILFKAIQKLPPNQKTVFTLNKVEGLNHEEISEIMKTTVSSIESLLHRAKENLRKELHNYYKKNI